MKKVSLIGFIICTILQFFPLEYISIDFPIFLIVMLFSILFTVLLYISLISDLKFNKIKEKQLNIKEFLIISLLSIYQPLYFYAHNVFELDFSFGLLICAIAFIQFILLYLILNLLFKDRNKSIYIAIILSYILLNIHSNTTMINVITLSLLLLIDTVSLDKLKKPVIAFSIVLTFLAVFEFVHNYHIIIKNNSTKKTENLSNSLSLNKIKAKSRDIYIILLDQYGGTDTLKKQFDFDNSYFINELKEEGFYVFDKMYSNYDTTYASIPSILNLDYMENIDFNTSSSAIENAVLYKIAKQNGYNTLYRKNDYFSLEPSDYIDYIEINSNNYNKLLTFFFNSIYRKLINSKQAITFFNKNKMNIPNHIFYSKGKKFVFLHMLIPHRPYLFDEYGNPAKSSYVFEISYLPFLKYANKWTLKEVKALKKNKKNLPVIIITGDHGMRHKPLLESNFSTFTAYYNPEQEYSHIKNSKTLLNFFINFTNYEFNTEFPLKKDYIICVRDVCGAKHPDETVTDYSIKKILEDTLDLTKEFIK